MTLEIQVTQLLIVNYKLVLLNSKFEILSFIVRKKSQMKILYYKPMLTSLVYYVPRRIMRVITRRATMLAGDQSQGVVEA